VYPKNVLRYRAALARFKQAFPGQRGRATAKRCQPHEDRTMSYTAALRTAVRRRSQDGPARFILPALFLVLVLPMLIFSALILPPGEVPDEVAHILRADSLLHGAIVGRRVPKADLGGSPTFDAVVPANAALATAGFAFVPGVKPKILTRQRLEFLKTVPWAPAATLASVPNTAVYMPLFYLPASFGIGVARAAGLGPYHAILTARLCNALSFTALGLLALLLARRAHAALFVALTLPMTVSVGASCNQDGILIAVSCLAAALLTRSTRPAWWAGAAALALVLAAKPLYLPLAALVFLAAPARVSTRARLTGALLATLPAIVWYGVAQHYAMVPFVRGMPYPAGPLWPGEPGTMFGTTDPARQMEVFLHQPSLILSLPIGALIGDFNVYMLGLVGVIGTLDLFLPPWLYTVWFWAMPVALAAVVLDGARKAPSWAPLASMLGVLAIAASVVALFDGQYLSWTAVGAQAVDGVQGRYLIPLLPMLGLVLPRLPVPNARTIRAVLLVAPVFAAAASLAAVPRLLVTTYYLR